MLGRLASAALFFLVTRARCPQAAKSQVDTLQAEIDLSWERAEDAQSACDAMRDESNTQTQLIAQLQAFKRAVKVTQVHLSHRV